jgi:signal transduction histidine kinase
MTDPTAARRREALDETALLDTLPEASFDRYTRLAARVLDVPVSLVSLVDDHRQFFKSQVGLGEPWASARETPLSHSFCLRVAQDDAALVVEDARADERVRGNLAITELDVIAYAGMPLRAPGGTPIGSFCAIDSRPRHWTSEDLRTLRDLADAVTAEITLRVAAARQRAFLSSASHELNTPLTALRLRLEDLTLWPEVGHDAAAELQQSIADVDRMSTAITSLVETARMDLLGWDEQVELAAIVGHAAQRWQPIVEGVGRSLDVQVGGAGRVHAPSAVLHQIIDVLLGNAVQHGDGRIQMVVTADANHAGVRVRDEGPGVAPQIAAGLFQGRTGKRSLSLAAELARTVGGHLLLLPGAPTTFDLLLPHRQSGAWSE